MAANAIDLCTLAEARRYVNVSGTDDDELLQQIITSTSEMFNRHCNRNLLEKEYTETFDGNGKTLMILENYPINSVLSLSINGANVAPYTFGASQGYIAKNHLLTVYGTAFVRGFQNVSINYMAGFQTPPYDLQQACLEVVALRYKERDRVGHISKQLGDETVSYLIKALTDNAQQTLKSYKRYHSRA